LCSEVSGGVPKCPEVSGGCVRKCSDVFGHSKAVGYPLRVTHILAVKRSLDRTSGCHVGCHCFQASACVLLSGPVPALLRHPKRRHFIPHRAPAYITMRSFGVALFLLFEDAVEFLGRSFGLTLPADHKLAIFRCPDLMLA